MFKKRIITNRNNVNRNSGRVTNTRAQTMNMGSGRRSNPGGNVGARSFLSKPYSGHKHGMTGQMAAMNTGEWYVPYSGSMPAHTHPTNIEANFQGNLHTGGHGHKHTTGVPNISNDNNNWHPYYQHTHDIYGGTHSGSSYYGHTNPHDHSQGAYGHETVPSGSGVHGHSHYPPSPNAHIHPPRRLPAPTQRSGGNGGNRKRKRSQKSMKRRSRRY